MTITQNKIYKVLSLAYSKNQMFNNVIVVIFLIIFTIYVDEVKPRGHGLIQTPGASQPYVIVTRSLSRVTWWDERFLFFHQLLQQAWANPYFPSSWHLGAQGKETKQGKKKKFLIPITYSIVNVLDTPQSIRKYKQEEIWILIPWQFKRTEWAL